MENLEILDEAGRVAITLHVGKGWFVFDAQYLPEGNTIRWVKA